MLPRDPRKCKSSNILWLLLILIFNACDENPVPEGSYFWTPTIKVEKGNGEATLFLIDLRPLALYDGPGPSNPDYFNVLISEDGENFSLYKKVDISTQKMRIENLTNEKPYYFLVTSHKKGHDAVESGVIMTIPSEKFEPEVYLDNVGFSITQLSISYDFSYISFIKDELLHIKAGTLPITPVEANADGASWSPTMNKLVYMTSILEGHTIFPFALKLFEPETNISTTLFEVPYNNYYVSNPTFTPDGEKITFFSSENNSRKDIYNLWTIDPATKERAMIANFTNIGFYTYSNYSWSKTGEDVYLDGRYNLTDPNASIYKINISTQELTPVIKSQWNDRMASPSPDNSKIAFISDRTGYDELWIFDLVNLKYSQVTGEPPYKFDPRYTNILWLNNDEILITLYEGSKSIPVKIKVN